jgi:hypothetical protein
MSNVFASGEEYQIEIAISYFKQIYSLSEADIHRNEAIHKDIPWRPSFYFKQKYSIMAFEISERPFPAIFYTAYASIMTVHQPIIVYSICTDENIKANEVKDLQRHGFGLFTINPDSTVSKFLDGIPLIQHIPEHEFLDECNDLPPKIKGRLREVYEIYKTQPQSGLSEQTALVEEIVNNVTKQMVKKAWLPETALKVTLANKLRQHILPCPNCSSATSSIAGLISFVADYRNMIHHSPKSQKQLYDKIHSCQHGFREGIKRLKLFNADMKQIGITLKAT